MKLRIEPYTVKAVYWWDHLDFVLSLGLTPQTRGEDFKWEHTGKLGGIHLHVQMICWCVDFWLTLREDITENTATEGSINK